MEKKILKTWPALPKRQAVVMEDGKLCLEIDREAEREKTSLLFYFGEYTKENYEVLEEVATLLFKTRRHGLCALTGYTMEDDLVVTKGIEPNGFIGGVAGSFDSQLNVENGRIIYKLESGIVPVVGTAWYDLGVATKNNINLKRKMIQAFEERGLMPAFFVTKHHYIDCVLPLEPTEDEYEE